MKIIKSWDFNSGDLTVTYEDGEQYFERFYGQGGRKWTTDHCTYDEFFKDYQDPMEVVDISGDSEEGWTTTAK